MRGVPSRCAPSTSAAATIARLTGIATRKRSAGALGGMWASVGAGPLTRADGYTRLMEQPSELERLRALVGPDEVAAARRAADLDAAVERIRVHEAEMGALRGRIAVLERDLRRAEQRLGLVGRLTAVRRRGLVTALRGRLRQRVR